MAQAWAAAVVISPAAEEIWQVVFEPRGICKRLYLFFLALFEILDVSLLEIRCIDIWLDVAAQVHISFALYAEFDGLVYSEVEVQWGLFDSTTFEIGEHELLPFDLGVQLHLAFSCCAKGRVRNVHNVHLTVAQLVVLALPQYRSPKHRKIKIFKDLIAFLNQPQSKSAFTRPPGFSKIHRLDDIMRVHLVQRRIPADQFTSDDVKAFAAMQQIHADFEFS
jgi:hypothetical protein